MDAIFILVDEGLHGSVLGQQRRLAAARAEPIPEMKWGFW